MEPERVPPRRTERRETVFTILEYMEFTGGAEFQKFRGMPMITHGEIAGVDWRALSEALLSSA